MTIAESQAKSNDLLGESLVRNPALVQVKWIEKWDGHLPQVSGGSTPLIQIPTPAK